MAMHEQTPDQTTPTRPTSEQATEAQAYFARPEILDVARNAIRHELGENGIRHFETILAVAKAPTDEDIAHAYVRQFGYVDAEDVRMAFEHALWMIKNSDAGTAQAFFAKGARSFFGSVKP